MKFKEVIQDFIKLESMRLNSIRPGAEITILNIDLAFERILIRNAAGKTNYRPISELEKIWDKLLTEPAVHVDEVLHGSGSSRNQPETIFANLPYIEWTKINNKKHIVYVGKKTHPYGTIQEVNPLEKVKIIELIKKKKERNYVLIVTKDIMEATDNFARAFGIKPDALESGIYSFQVPNGRIVFASSLKVELPCDTYFFLSLNHERVETIKFLGDDYYNITIDNINYLCKA